MKIKYDYPNAKGEVICSYCNFKTDLPANFCCGCGKEIENYKKQGLVN